MTTATRVRGGTTAMAVGLFAMVLAACGGGASESVTSSTEPAAAATSSAAPTSSEPAPTPTSEPTDAAPAPAPGSYITLAEYEADKAAYDAGDVVLFFNASWCSTCKIARDNLTADPAAIPEGLTIVTVDFDEATDLKQQYGVTLQHTFVQIGPDGAELAKWSGSVTAEEIAGNTV
jgi:thiol-disulfide isomerase/thioredoxin